MDKASWNTGRQLSSTEIDGRHSDDVRRSDDARRSDEVRRKDDMEFWKSVLSNSHLRSRFIRDLEVQSITSRSAEDLARRYREEEILPRR